MVDEIYVGQQFDEVVNDHLWTYVKGSQRLVYSDGENQVVACFNDEALEGLGRLINGAYDGSFRDISPSSSYSARDNGRLNEVVRTKTLPLHDQDSVTLAQAIMKYANQ